MSTLLFHPADQKDDSFLFELYAANRQEEVASWGWPLDQQKSFLHMQWLAQRTSYKAQVPSAKQTIVTIDQNPIGQFTVDYTPTHLHLIDISILPLFRNQGIGTSIIRNLQQEFILLAKPINLNVMKGNPASRLYERLGFVYTGNINTTSLYMPMTWLPPNYFSNGEELINECSVCRGN